MQQIDETGLKEDLPYRFGYLAGFMEFSEDDVAAIDEAMAHLDYSSGRKIKAARQVVLCLGLLTEAKRPL